MKRNQKGQTFPFVLIILAIGSVLVSGFLTSTNTSVLNANVYSDPIPDIYAADAGIEDAIWGLQYGTLLDKLAESGGYLEYTLPETVNDLPVYISVTGSSGAIASHDFNDYNMDGGTGWLDRWRSQGITLITWWQYPYEGAAHLLLFGRNAYAQRSIDLSGQSNVRLQFWAKVNSFEGTDTLHCLVSPDRKNWTVVKTWDRRDSDNKYDFVEIDLSSFEMSSEFWIAFDSEVDWYNDYFFVDYLTVTSSGGSYTVKSVAGEKTITEKVTIPEGTKASKKEATIGSGLIGGAMGGK